MGTGKDAQCIQFQTPSGQMSAGCFEIICTESKENYIVKFNRKEKQIIECNEFNIGINQHVGLYLVKCVDPKVMCRDRNTKCPFDCFYRGKCRESGVCTCNFFFQGDYCEDEKPFPKGMKRLWNKIKEFNGF